jgi:hypothetical protein
MNLKNISKNDNCLYTKVFTEEDMSGHSHSNYLTTIVEEFNDLF